MPTNTVEVPDSAIQQALVKKLSKDMRAAAATLGVREARYFVDSYYDLQDYRIAAANQQRKLLEGAEPSGFMSWLNENLGVLEKQIGAVLDKWSAAQPMGVWARNITGVGPVIAAGLLANIDITKAPTVGHIWRFAGLDPTVKWLPKTKRPWNASLKRLCCLPGTTITTRSGPKLIEHVQIGDEVLTHKGRWRKVTEVMVNDHDGPIVQLRAHGLAGGGPMLTGNHPVLVKQMRVCYYEGEGREKFRVNPRKMRVTQLADSVWEEIQERIAAGEKGAHIARMVGCSDALISKIRHGYTRQPTGDSTSWVRADEAQIGWRLFCPTPPIGRVVPRMVLDDLERLHNPAKRRDVEVTHDVARLIGLFLGDGHTSKNRAVWSFGLHESDLSGFVINTLRSVFGIEANERITHNMRIVACGSKQLQLWLDRNIGKTAHHKRIPEGWMEADELIITGLLRGLFESDGHLGKTTVNFSSVNWGLAQSVVMLLRMLRIPATAVRHKITTALPGDGRIRSCSFYRIQPPDITAFYLRVMGENREPRASTSVAEWEAEGSWHTVQAPTGKTYSGPVYNMEVEEDHSYTADGVAVHNCWLCGESFVKVSGHERDRYGKLYLQRKEYEAKRNDAGGNAEAAAERLKQPGAKKLDPGLIAILQTGKLPQIALHERSKRWAVKLFLAHWHSEAYRQHYHKEPPLPYPIAILGHSHMVEP